MSIYFQNNTLKTSYKLAKTHLDLEILSPLKMSHQTMDAVRRCREWSQSGSILT